MAEEGDTSSRRPKRGDRIDATHGLVQLILLGLSILVAVAIDTGSSSRGILFVLLILFSWVLPVSLLMAQARPGHPPSATPPEPPRPACGQCGIDLRPGATQCHWCHWRMPSAREEAPKS